MTNATNPKAANEIINVHFEAWTDGSRPLGQRAVEGFTVFCADMTDDTRACLELGKLEQVAEDVLYSIAQEDRSANVCVDDCIQWLKDNRTELIEALSDERATA
jgi:hypothetical protein